MTDRGSRTAKRDTHTNTRANAMWKQAAHAHTLVQNMRTRTATHNAAPANVPCAKNSSQYRVVASPALTSRPSTPPAVIPRTAAAASASRAYTTYSPPPPAADPPRGMTSTRATRP